MVKMIWWDLSSELMAEMMVSKSEAEAPPLVPMATTTISRREEEDWMRERAEAPKVASS